MEYTFSDEIIEEIKEKNDVVDVISEYVNLKRTGSYHVGLCPFHNEKTPSFTASSSKQFFHCFGCGEGGDVIAFIMKHLNLDFIEALQLLADRVGIQLEKKNSRIDKEEEKKKKKLYEINREAAIFFYKNLFNNNNALEYLQNRGISRDTIKTFGIGYSTNDWEGLLKHLRIKGYNEKVIAEAGLIIRRKDNSGYYDRFRHRVIFPIINTKDKVIGFGGRVLDSSKPKYLNSPDTPIFNKGYNLYGLNIIKKYFRGKKIILVEGYMDVISLNQHGIKYSVASLGTAFTNAQAKLLKRYCNEFYICYDSDVAGQNATNKALEILKSEGIDAKVIILPDGKDPDEFIKKYGKDSFDKQINKSLNYLDYKIYSFNKKYNLNTIEGKISFTKGIAAVLKKIDSSIEKEAYIGKISKETGISVDAISNEVYGNKTRTKDKYINDIYRNNNKYRIKPVKYSMEPGHLIAEKNLLNLIIKDKSIFEKIKNSFKPQDFLNDIYSEVAHLVYLAYKFSDKLDYDEIYRHFESESLHKVKEVIDLDLQFEDREKNKAVEDYITNINYFKLKLKRRQIKERLREIESEKEKTKGDVEKLNQLCEQLINIDKELKLHQ